MTSGRTSARQHTMTRASAVIVTAATALAFVVIPKQWVVESSDAVEEGRPCPKGVQRSNSDDAL
ncbi:hypothetical protein [Saccharopolyspora soli]|uniref:hypothetical protein n=1 Tax=Saccharopolyspora soli TaxID=2926618 RepID=UPI001F5AD1D4|nr:hypothetical protein [Saccharopolyspora soli]